MVDSPEAEALRDQMDDFWYRLTDDEIAELDRLSAGLRSRDIEEPNGESGSEDIALREVGGASRTRLLIAVENEIVRVGLRAMLAGEAVDVVGEAATADAIIRYALDNKVDVILLQVRPSPGVELETVKQIKAAIPNVSVLLLSAAVNRTFVARAIASGASGNVPMACTRDELLLALATVSRGESIWSPRELQPVSPEMSADAEIALTTREYQVLRSLADGLTSKEIAESLEISYSAVKEHVEGILRKIGHATEVENSRSSAKLIGEVVHR